MRRSALALAVMLFSLSAGADDAARLKKEGDAFMDAERYAEAAQSYAKAYAISHDPPLVYNEGRALEALGEYPDAVARLEKFRATAPPALLTRVARLDEHIAELKHRIATISVSSNVRGAQLVVRSKVVAKLDPNAEIIVRAGPASIEVSAEGYETWRRDMDLAPRSLTRLDIILKARAPMAVLAIRSRPSASDVFIDGQGVGRTPFEVSVRPGPHDLRFAHLGHEDEKMSVSLKGGERRELEATLPAEQRSIASRWWFWAGIGVIAAAATITTIVIVTTDKTRPAASGDFSPPQIPASIRF